MYIYTIKKSDVGKSIITIPNPHRCNCPFCQTKTKEITLHLHNFIGAIQTIDVGKRLSVTKQGTIQMENNEQLKARKEAK